MAIKNISQAPDFDSSKFVAKESLEGTESSVRIIGIIQGTLLPTHCYGTSDLELFV